MCDVSIVNRLSHVWLSAAEDQRGYLRCSIWFAFQRCRTDPVFTNEAWLAVSVDLWGHKDVFIKHWGSKEDIKTTQWQTQRKNRLIADGCLTFFQFVWRKQSSDCSLLRTMIFFQHYQALLSSTLSLCNWTLQRSSSGFCSSVSVNRVSTKRTAWRASVRASTVSYQRPLTRSLLKRSVSCRARWGMHTVHQTALIDINPTSASLCTATENKNEQNDRCSLLGTWKSCSRVAAGWVGLVFSPPSWLWNIYHQVRILNIW